ncbi:MAG: 1-acyl-sn-glycerol-3-phosphate acyltransferase, partial [Myxococcota bacterium]|nr:1-acyl-sn-glycerol-3-phosphate acyltransferase [Myxococcota bacterium]
CGVLSFIYLIGILNVLQVFTVVIYPLSPKLFRAINTWFARSIWGIWILMAEKLARTDMIFTGDDMPHGENAILVANHQTMADILMIICFAWRCGRLGNLKFFVKDEFKYVPGPVWGMLFMD